MIIKIKKNNQKKEKRKIGNNGTIIAIWLI